jgi:hypothetical protein
MKHVLCNTVLYGEREYKTYALWHSALLRSGTWNIFCKIQCFTERGNMKQAPYDTVLYWEREHETCSIRYSALLREGIWNIRHTTQCFTEIGNTKHVLHDSALLRPGIRNMCYMTQCFAESGNRRWGLLTNNKRPYWEADCCSTSQEISSLFTKAPDSLPCSQGSATAPISQMNHLNILQPRCGQTRIKMDHGRSSPSHSTVTFLFFLYLYEANLAVLRTHALPNDHKLQIKFLAILIYVFCNLSRSIRVNAYIFYMVTTMH